MKAYDLEFHLRTIIHDEVRVFVAAGGKIGQRAGVAPQTVSRLVYQETVHPRMKTVLCVIGALGYELELKKRDKNQLRPPTRAVS